MEMAESDVIGLLEGVVADSDECMEIHERKRNEHFVPDPNADLPVYITIQR